MVNTTVSSINISGTTYGRSTDKSDVDLITHIYQYMLAATLLLSVFILVHDSIIFMDYFPSRRKFVASMFMLITACDMLTAFGSLLQGIPAVICLLDGSARFPNWSNGIYFPISGNFYQCSVFYTVVLSVKKNNQH